MTLYNAIFCRRAIYYIWFLIPIGLSQDTGTLILLIMQYVYFYNAIFCHWWSSIYYVRKYFLLWCIHYFAIELSEWFASPLDTLIDLNFDEFFKVTPSSSTRGHPYKLYRQRGDISVRENFFSQRVVNIWNSLSEKTVDFTSLTSFTRTIKLINFRKYLKCSM